MTRWRKRKKLGGKGAVMRNRSGFTLIEMLLATVLTAVLMVGVLAVVVSVSGPIQAGQGDGQAMQLMETDDVVRVLRADLAQARTLETAGGELVLMSYGSLDPLTGERTQRPVDVRYRVQTIGVRSWLVREEQPLDGEAALAVRTELVAAGVSRLELDPPTDLPVIRASGEGGRDSKEDADEETPTLPEDGLWRLRLWREGQSQAVLDTGVVMRRSLAP